jgi:hypothetical protein
MLASIVEDKRRVSASREPHAIATDGRTAWVSSRVTRKVDVYQVDSWRKVGELQPPGMTCDGGDVVMTCGEEEDHRRIRRYRSGALVGDPIACPDDTGSQLSVAGRKLLLGQWYRQKLHMLGADGSVLRTYDAPHQVAGVAVVDGAAFVLGTDEEQNGAYYITRVDLESGTVVDVALVSFRARGLAWDGKQFWSNDREADRIVTFALP